MKTIRYKIMANARDAIGTHENTLTKRSKSGALLAGTLVCFDTDTAYVKACTEDKTPWGVVKQNATEAEGWVTIQLLSGCSHTAQLKAAGAVKAGDKLCLADNGCAQALPSTSGTYQIVGLALTDGEADSLFEALTTLPYTQTIA